jgi:mono/diheme cytochrome c family protein
MTADKQTPSPLGRAKKRWAVLTVAALLGSLAQAQETQLPSRGELLYTTHCVACHTTQMHWRADRQAVDWDSLKLQVRRWQGNAGLQWGEADITEVSRYLNEAIYRYPLVNERVGKGIARKAEAVQARSAP